MDYKKPKFKEKYENFIGGKFVPPVVLFIKSFNMDYKKPKFKEKYENFIGGKFVPPVENEYFENNSPIDNTLIAKYPRSQKEDIDHAVIAANKAKEAWGNTSAAERAGLLNEVADIIEANLEEFALVETCDNGKPIRETLNADIPLSVDHWRYFASAIRAEESTMSELDPPLVLSDKLSLGIFHCSCCLGNCLPHWRLATVSS